MIWLKDWLNCKKEGKLLIKLFKKNIKEKFTCLCKKIYKLKKDSLIKNKKTWFLKQSNTMDTLFQI